MEIKCVRCKKDLHIRVYAEKILVAANSPHEGAVMVAEESVQYSKNKKDPHDPRNFKSAEEYAEHMAYELAEDDDEEWESWYDDLAYDAIWEDAYDEWKKVCG